MSNHRMERRMAEIVSIGERLGQVQRLPPAMPVNAKILFFTGIRYERLEDALNAPSGNNAANAKKS